MSITPFLLEWTLRSSLLIVAGALLLCAFRIKDASVQQRAWTAVLVGCLAIPALAALLPALPVRTVSLSYSELPGVAPEAASTVHAVTTSAPAPSQVVAHPGPHAATTGPGGPTADRDRSWLTGIYAVGVGALLLRMLVGIAFSARLRRRSTPTGRTTEGIDIRESKHLPTPATLGIFRPVILLPDDWREWDDTTLEAVLAHERSHIGRQDPAVQALSMIHRALFWHNPLSWFLHRRLVQTAEDASDDAALGVTGDRTAYAEILLHFMRHRLRHPLTFDVAMARYGSPVQRIERILEGAPISHGVRRPAAAAIIAIGLPLACVVAAAQGRPTFEVADVHVSPPRADGRGLVMEGGTVRGGRYEIHNATLVDLIAAAFGVAPDAVVGGPSWLAVDRFNVIAKAPDAATAESLELMLQALLADRFSLATRPETRPMPAWVLSKGKGEPKLRPAVSADESRCDRVDDNERLSCRNVTMDAFVTLLRRAPLTALPVLNSTGIEGAWDFDLRYSMRGFGVSENNPIIEAIDSQLGLRVERRDVPQSMLVVESVDRVPTPNIPNIEARLPPDPAAFEVASIRPCEKVDLRGWRSSPSGQMTTGCLPLSMHISRAWNLGTPIQAAANQVLSTVPVDIPGAPGWIDSKQFEIVAKASVAVERPATDAKYRTMLRNLLLERFRMVTHYENRLVDVFTLAAAAPKLKQADPAARTGCRSTGIAPGGPTIITCQNVTMAQFADELNRAFAIVATGRRVLDETGIEGAWDLTLSYRVAALPAPVLGVASDPTGDLSVEQALERQLGLKLQRARRPVPVFVIDHVEENPTEN